MPQRLVDLTSTSQATLATLVHSSSAFTDADDHNTLCYLGLARVEGTSLVITAAGLFALAWPKAVIPLSLIR